MTYLQKKYAAYLTMSNIVSILYIIDIILELSAAQTNGDIHENYHQ